MVGRDNLEGLLQPTWFNDYKNIYIIFKAMHNDMWILFEIFPYVNNKLIISIYLFSLENLQQKMRRQQVIPLR